MNLFIFGLNSLYLQKTYGGNNTIIYKQIIFKIKEYQIKMILQDYLIVFSPLSDKKFSGDKIQFFLLF